jgi:hypothetical protein
LQSSTDLKNWQEVGEAANPFVIDPSDSWNFFRVIER